MSSFRIVPVVVRSAKVAPVAEKSFSFRVSSSSASLSPLTVMLIVFCVSPVAKVILPDWAT